MLRPYTLLWYIWTNRNRPDRIGFWMSLHGMQMYRVSRNHPFRRFLWRVVFRIGDAIQDRYLPDRALIFGSSRKPHRHDLAGGHHG